MTSLHTMFTMLMCRTKLDLSRELSEFISLEISLAVVSCSMFGIWKFSHTMIYYNLGSSLRDTLFESSVGIRPEYIIYLP